MHEIEKHLTALSGAAVFAHELGLEVHAGHGLTYKNIERVSSISVIEGFYIGHSIMSRAIYVGLYRAVRDMIQLINKTQKG